MLPITLPSLPALPITPDTPTSPTSIITSTETTQETTQETPQTIAPTISPQWQQEWQQAQAELEANTRLLQSSRGPKIEILRVNQLDAIKLDQEINEVLKQQFMKVFTFMKVSLKYYYIS